MFRPIYHPILATERPPTAVQRLADYYQRAAVINARAKLDPDHDPRTRNERSDTVPVTLAS